MVWSGSGGRIPLRSGIAESAVFCSSRYSGVSGWGGEKVTEIDVAGVSLVFVAEDFQRLAVVTIKMTATECKIPLPISEPTSDA